MDMVMAAHAVAVLYMPIRLRSTAVYCNVMERSADSGLLCAIATFLATTTTTTMNRAASRLLDRGGGRQMALLIGPMPQVIFALWH